MNSKEIHGPQTVRLVIKADGNHRVDREVNLPEDIVSALVNDSRCTTTVTGLTALTFTGNMPALVNDVINENPGCKIVITIDSLCSEPDSVLILAAHLLSIEKPAASGERPTPTVEDEDLPPELGDDSTKPKRRVRQPKSTTPQPAKKRAKKAAAAALRNCPADCLARDVNRVLLAMAERGDAQTLLPDDFKVVAEETNLKSMTPNALKLNAGKLTAALADSCPELTTTKLVTEEAMNTKDLTKWFDKNFRGRAASREHPQLPKHALGILKVALRELGHGKYRAT